MRTNTFAVVRPYSASIRRRVFAFLESVDLRLGEGMSLPPGTADDVAAEWIDRQPPFDLLLLPFHVHRGEDGVFDGVGVALRLSDRFVAREVPILMPVSAYSMKASFDRRRDELRQARPELVRQLVLMPEAEIGSATVAAQLRRRLAKRGSPRGAT